MRLWSLHPRYLDAKGLVALWREGLLAQKVLAGETRGYRHHPQLIRFRQQPHPQKSMGAYLSHIAREADRRGYHFQKNKIRFLPDAGAREALTIPVSTGQLEYERQHLIRKLQKRDPGKLAEWQNENPCQPHPLFTLVNGPVAEWEVV